MPTKFLTAQWHALAMLNYGVAPALLEPLVPRGTELDLWEGTAYISLVGFMFRRTRLLGIPIPLHTTFEEVNLRFYVRRVVDGEVRRGVTFIKELVPRFAIAALARATYNEPYEAVPMRSRVQLPQDGGRGEVEYGWRHAGAWSGLRVQPEGESGTLVSDSEEEFITEHYWGYTRQRDSSTIEYRVEHPRWRVWRVSNAVLTGDVTPLYGDAFASAMKGPPASAFLADGSDIAVYRPTRL